MTGRRLEIVFATGERPRPESEPSPTRPATEEEIVELVKSTFDAQRALVGRVAAGAARPRVADIAGSEHVPAVQPRTGPVGDGTAASDVSDGRTRPTGGRGHNGAVFSPSVENLVAQLTRLPGIGQRTAQRLAFHILQRPPEEALALAAALTEVKERVRFCRECGNLTEEETCAICLDARRDHTTICVVEQPVDVVSLERTARLPRPLPRARRRAQPDRRRRPRPTCASTS